VAAWRWWIHLLLIGTYPLVIGLLSHLQSGSQVREGAALGDTSKELLIGSFLTLGTFAVVFGLGWFASRATLDDLRLRWRQGWMTWVWGGIYSVALRIGVAGVMLGLIGLMVLFGQVEKDKVSEFVMENKPDVEAVVSVKALGSDPLYMALSLTFVSFIVAGLREELWRSATLVSLEKLFPKACGGRWGKSAAVVVIAVAFGLGHIPQGMLAVVMTGVLGLGLGAIIVFHRSIWPAVLAHGFFDATSLALIPLAFEMIEKLKPMVGQ
jgi:membrane protease YdiL (CAAX protease family)